MWDSVGIETLGGMPSPRGDASLKSLASMDGSKDRSLPPAASKSYSVVRTPYIRIA